MQNKAPTTTALDNRPKQFAVNMGCVSAMYSVMGEAWTTWQEQRRSYAVAVQSRVITSETEKVLRPFKAEQEHLKQVESAVLTCTADQLQTSVANRDTARSAALEPLNKSVTSHLALIHALDQEIKVLSSLVDADARPVVQPIHDNKVVLQAATGIHTLAVEKWAALHQLHTEIGTVEQQVREGLDSLFVSPGNAATISHGLELLDKLAALQLQRDAQLQSIGHTCKRFFRLLPVHCISGCFSFVYFHQ